MKNPRILLIAIAAALLVPTGSMAGHCSKVLMFSQIAAGRGANPGLVGCELPGEQDTNRLVPGTGRVIVVYTGGRAHTPAGTITINGTETGLSGPTWDTDRWSFASVPLPAGAATVRATVYPASDPTRAESVTYTKAA